MTELKQVLMKRDELDNKEADLIIEQMKELIHNGENPEEVLMNEVGLEPDYIFDLI